MKKLLSYGIGGVTLACIALWLVWSRGSRVLSFDTPYQALLLDNGAVYYARIQRMEGEFSVLTDVYYVQSQVDTQTKQSRSVLIRRGNEWHAPNRTVVSNRHIVMIEPVTPNSKLAELITQLKSKNP